MRALKVMLGTWDVNTKMIPSPGKSIPESGTMTCKTLYDSTYIECDATLSSGRFSRGYKLFVTYEPDSSRYSQIYLYTGTPMRVIETGNFFNNEFRTTTKIVNNGVAETISTMMKIESKDKLYFESRSSATKDQVDYTALFKRKS